MCIYIHKDRRTIPHIPETFTSCWNMRVLLILGTVLLCTLVLADHKEGHHEGNDDHHEGHHEGNDDHHDQKHDHDHKDGHDKKGEDYHHNMSLSCHKIAHYNSLFSFDLFRQVALDHPSENIVFSPVSISMAFSFLSIGAKAQTRSQIINGLRLNASEISEQEIHECFHNLLDLLNDVKREVQLGVGNALFVSKEYKILHAFLDQAKKLYHSEAFSTDFKNTEEAKNQINTYVEKNTHGKIAELLNSVDENAILYLINYIHFKAKWQKPFDEESTEEEDFHVNENTTVKVPFMFRIGYYDVAIHDDATVVSLPYKGDAKALIIMPNEGKLSEIEKHLCKEEIKKLKKSMSNEFVKLRFPKFSVSGTVNLKETLKKLGIEDVFSDSADLSGITGAPNVKISKGVHKAVLNVNEHGTEAAGATALEGTPMMLPHSVKIDRPFLFLLYDYITKSILFMGRIVNPQK
ncbi:alpha-1-antitrypsin-like [Bufo bufo]|uniref:alpha-1-antitrypsin-like n=1 Tax=Bufo bufo TaxID=8384 RepID=UPI001ABE8704|nr:alpha-1-antitrypsin-like [Bufo bufo]